MGDINTNTKVLDSIYKLGGLLMEWKISDWNNELKKDTCPCRYGWSDDK